MQFQHWLAQPDNREIVKDDEGELAALMAEIGYLAGSDINKLLQTSPALTMRAGWFHTKYNGFLGEVSRTNTTNYNLVYNQLRDKGYGEWDAKRQAETNSAWIKANQYEHRLKVLVDIMKLLVDACKERLATLQQISNNYRAELRDVSL